MNRRHRNALPPGYRLHWYEIDSILGQGGFGITYLARDTNLDQLVAIKEFLPQELAVRDSDSSVHPVTEGHQDTFGWGLSRFLTEAQTLAKFRHPNIVLVHSVFEANNTAYMVMQYERGRSLDDALKFRKIQGEAAVKALTWLLLDGLELLHEAGFIHRDIKPQNVYIRDDGTPVLLDFGSARLALGGATRTLTTLVSPGYAPFEQYEASSEGGRQGPWTDIYSLGATLYLAVTGQGPPDAVKRAQARLAGDADPLVPARVEAGPGYSPGFLYAIDSALAFQAAERPKSIAQWRKLLESREAPGATPGDDATVRVDPHAAAPPVEGPAPGRSGGDAEAGAPAAHRRRPPAARHRARRPLRLAGLALLLAVAGAGAWFAGMRETGELPAASARTPQPTAPDPQTVTRAAPAEAPSTGAQPAAPATGTLERDTPVVAPAAPDPVVDLEAARIDVLLADASRALAEGRLIAPPGDSALHYLREALRLDPGNPRALAERARLQRVLLERASQALDAGDLAGAESHLAEAAGIDPDAPALGRERRRLADAREVVRRAREQAAAEAVRRAEAEEQARRRAEIEEQTRRRAEAERLAEEAAVREDTPRARVARLLADAERDLAATRLTSPAGNNALHKYRRVLDIEPDSEAARAGMRRIVQRYLELAEAAAARGRDGEVNTFLSRAERVIPGSARVAAARASLLPPAEPAASPPAAAPRTPPVEPAPAAAAALPPADVAPAPAPPSPAPPSPRLRAPAQLAVMPVQTKRSCFEPDDLRARDAAVGAAREVPGVRLVFDAFEDPSRASLQERVWAGSRTERVPAMAEVGSVAASLDADVVFMAFIDCSHRMGDNRGRFEFTFWAIDMDTGRTLTSRGRLPQMATRAQQLLQDVVAARAKAGG